jgi:hypothetical protein
MEKNTVKTVPLIITIVAVVGIAALLINASKHPVPTADTTASSSASNSLCYVLNAPSQGGNGNDTAYLKLTSSDGGQTVTGELGTALAEKDAMTGTLQGTVTASSDNSSATFDGQYINMGEGMSNVNEQMIQLTEQGAQIGYGDMAQNADGTYSYKDKSAITYSLTIPSVDCTQYDSLKAAAGF